MEKSAKEKGTVYNEAKIYQIALFSLNNAATNLYLALDGIRVLLREFHSPDSAWF